MRRSKYQLQPVQVVYCDPFNGYGADQIMKFEFIGSEISYLFKW